MIRADVLTGVFLASVPVWSLRLSVVVVLGLVACVVVRALWISLRGGL